MPFCVTDIDLGTGCARMSKTDKNPAAGSLLPTKGDKQQTDKQARSSTETCLMAMTALLKHEAGKGDSEAAEGVSRLFLKKKVIQKSLIEDFNQDLNDVRGPGYLPEESLFVE